MTGEEFKAVLREIGWKQIDIARKMGMHRNTIYDWVTSGPPLWAAEYVQAILAIKRLHDAFVKVSSLTGKAVTPQDNQPDKS